MSDQVDERRCPSCGEENDCGVARGAGTCWCFSAEVSPSAIAEAGTRDACLCRGCASGARSPQQTARLVDQLLKNRR